MRLHNLFHLCSSEPIFLAENSFSDQRQALLTENYLKEFENIDGNAAARKGGGGVLQLTEHGIPIAIAVYVHSQGFDHWLVSGFQKEYLISSEATAKRSKPVRPIYAMQ